MRNCKIELSASSPSKLIKAMEDCRDNERIPFLLAEWQEEYRVERVIKARRLIHGSRLAVHMLNQFYRLIGKNDRHPVTLHLIVREQDYTWLRLKYNVRDLRDNEFCPNPYEL